MPVSSLVIKQQAARITQTLRQLQRRFRWKLPYQFATVRGNDLDHDQTGRIIDRKIQLTPCGLYKVLDILDRIFQLGPPRFFVLLDAQGRRNILGLAGRVTLCSNRRVRQVQL
ncbi:hypothetical protein D3C87_1775980 [compost metagenome]